MARTPEENAGRMICAKIININGFVPDICVLPWNHDGECKWISPATPAPIAAQTEKPSGVSQSVTDLTLSNKPTIKQVDADENDQTVEDWFEEYCYEQGINFAKRIEVGSSDERLDEITPKMLKAYAASLKQETQPPSWEPKIFRLGLGEVMLEVGDYGDNKALFIEPAPTPGTVGKPADMPKDSLQEGSVILVVHDHTGLKVLADKIALLASSSPLETPAQDNFSFHLAHILDICYFNPSVASHGCMPDETGRCMIAACACRCHFAPAPLEPETPAAVPGFSIKISFHTDTINRFPLDGIRELIGNALDMRGIEEEIDYTLEVARIHG